MLRVHELTKRFGGVTAVDNCSFEIEEGSVTGLVGPNGAGKTTIINLITGFLRPDHGEIYFKERNITGLKPHEIKRKKIIRTFQITRVFPQMSVLENMLVPLQEEGFLTLFRKKMVKEEKKKALDLLEFIEMARFKDEYSANLSFGQKKMLELVSILMPDPQFIILDEPVAGLNPVIIEKILDYIKRLRKRGKTFLVVEHNIRVVSAISDKIIVLDSGQKIAEGTIEEIQLNERVKEAYLGRA